MELKEIGWTQYFEENFEKYGEKGLKPGRISSAGKNIWRVITDKGEINGIITGKMIYEEEFPAVGDWCAVNILDGEDKAVIEAVLPRKSKFTRKERMNSTKEQIITANVDIVFIVMALNGDYNLRRMERYITIVWESGAVPVIVLSKTDLCYDIETKVREVEEIAPGIDIYPISSYKKEGLEALKKYFKSGRTISMVGSSGAGKSTLINTITGKEIMETNSIREDDSRGRHTTTHREMIIVEECVIIDNPGMREIQVLDFEEGLSNAFNDITALSLECRFSDCRHESEPGCAVKKALHEGTLDIKRYQSYQKIKKEMEYAAKREDGSYDQMRKERGKAINKFKKQLKKG